MLGLAGWRVAYAGNARAWTQAPATLGSLWRQRYRLAYGTMQAAYKHCRQLGAAPVTGAGGGCTHLGRLGLPYLLAFGVALPLLAPLVGLFAVVGLLFASPAAVAVGWVTFGAVQFALAAYALYLDGERLRTLWALPLQQVVYRQLMYLVVVQSTLAALTGTRLSWHNWPAPAAPPTPLNAGRQPAASKSGTPLHLPGRPARRRCRLPEAPSTNSTPAGPGVPSRYALTGL